jgi:hypothetical protein
MAEGKEPEKPQDGGSPASGDVPKTAESQLTAWVKAAGDKLVPLIVSAVVSVGFVAFAGKAVLWTRFQALQVPADQVVRVVPQSEAVAVGASMLLIFGLLGALGALGVFLVDRGGRATQGMSQGLLVILGIEGLVAIWLTEGKPVVLQILASEVLLLGVGAIFWSTFVSGLITFDFEVPDLKDDEEQEEPERGPFFRLDGKLGVTAGALIAAVAFGFFSGALGFALTLLFGGSASLAWAIGVGVLILMLLGAVLRHWSRFVRAEAKKGEAGAAAGKGAARVKPRGVSLKPAGIAFALVMTVMAVVAPPVLLHEWWLGVALGAVALLGAGLWRIALLSKKRFVWYGLAVFISVPLFATVMLMARNISEPMVQPMALIRETDGPDEAIQGLYVTETSDRVYFANVATEGCEETVTPDSGRLLWVPKSEVVAMSLGPLQSVEQAGRSALEMSYDLTPGIETGGATVNLLDRRAPAAAPSGSVGEAGGESGGTEAAGGDGASDEAGDESGGEAGDEVGQEGSEGMEEKEAEEPPAGSSDNRLENVGPAVRPNFGTGLRIEPEIVTPGGEATLRMNRENTAVEGFGPSRAGHNLRLGGTVVDIAKEPAGAAEGAEYIEVESGRLVALGKEGSYVEVGGEYVPEEEAGDNDRAGGEDRYVRLNDPALLEVNGKSVSEDSPVYVKVNEDGKDGAEVASGAQEVRLAGGTFEGRPWENEVTSLVGRPLLRQAWHTDHIRFHVPVDAHSGVVTVECDQLAGAPLLQVNHAPSARIVAQMQPNSTGVSFDSSRSSGNGEEEELNGEKEELLRRWRVDGVRRGHGGQFSTRMPPRRSPYTVELTVTDKAGNTDTAKLRVLRLPTLDPGAGGKRRRALEMIEAARAALEKSVEEEQPRQVEIDGFTDRAGPFDRNLKLSLAAVDDVRKVMMHEPDQVPTGQHALPIEELGYGESCPIDRRHGPRSLNRHVDVFLLVEGVVVKPAKGCHPGSQKRVLWHPPVAPGAVASTSSSSPPAGAESTSP